MMKNMKKWFVSFAAIALLVAGCSQPNKESKPKTTKVEATNTKGGLVTPLWSENTAIYEVNLRQYTEEGTIKAFQKHLPRLKEMGVSTLWLMPIYPISEKNHKGELGSPYAIKDYKAVNPDLGTMKDLKTLVDEAHKAGMTVMLDWVANHTGWDNPWVKNKSWYLQTPEGKIMSPPNTDWTDVAALNYQNKDMRKAMIDAMKFWVKEADIDGFRCDHATGVPVDFWNKARAELNEIKPMFMLAEDNSIPEFLYKAFNSNYGWNYFGAIKAIGGDAGDVNTIKSYLDQASKDYPENSYPMLFTTNHDENSWNGTEYELFGDGADAMNVLTFVMPGVPMIYGGQEAGLSKRLKFFEKDPIDWSNNSREELFKKLISLKKENQALWNGTAGGTAKVLPSSNDQMLVLAREKEDDHVVLVMNLSKEPIKGDAKFGQLAGEYTTYFGDGSKTTLQPTQPYDLKPYEYRVYIQK